MGTEQSSLKQSTLSIQKQHSESFRQLQISHCLKQKRVLIIVFHLPTEIFIFLFIENTVFINTILSIHLWKKKNDVLKWKCWCPHTVDTKYYAELRLNVNNNPSKILHLYVTHILTLVTCNRYHIFAHARVLVAHVQ